MSAFGRRVVAGSALVCTAAHLPAAASIGPLRRATMPLLAGVTDADHVALTFDDGPDEVSTPLFLDLLERHDRRATFFVLGEHLAGHRDLVEEIARRGHEVGVHGWTHRCTVLRRPAALADDLRRTRDQVVAITGRPVVHYRPPYGVLTTGTMVAARRAGLTPVLWSAWGRDWEARATPGSIVRTVRRTLRPGGTVLLHDSDRAGTPGSWRATLVATDVLLDDWTSTGTAVGTLAEHAADRAVRAAPRVAAGAEAAGRRRSGRWQVRAASLAP